METMATAPDVLTGWVHIFELLAFTMGGLLSLFAIVFSCHVVSTGVDRPDTGI